METFINIFFPKIRANTTNSWMREEISAITQEMKLYLRKKRNINPAHPAHIPFAKIKKILTSDPYKFKGLRGNRTLTPGSATLCSIR